MRTHAERRVPGDPVIWALFLGDATMFSAFFLSFANDRRHQRDLFAMSQGRLYQSVGLVNTLTLLLSSYVVVLGLTASRRGDRRRSSQLFAAACGLGVIFVVTKVIEWSMMIAAGYRAANRFFVYYFSLTGMHFLHACLGLAILAVLAVRMRKAPRGTDTQRFVESGCCYWHLVDLLWLILFMLVYVAP